MTDEEPTYDKQHVTYLCDRCNKYFKSKNGLIKHLGKKLPCNTVRDTKYVAKSLQPEKIHARILERLQIIDDLMQQDKMTASDKLRGMAMIDLFANDTREMRCALRLLGEDNEDAWKEFHELEQRIDETSKLFVAYAKRAKTIS